MSLLFPVYRSARCSPVARAARSDFGQLFSLIDDAFSTTPVRHQRRSFAPRFNVSEASDFYQLEGELPGVEQKDISVEFTDEHTLLIKGRVDKHTTSGSTPQVAPVEPSPAESTPVDDAASQTSSRQATVEDDREGDWTDVAPAAGSEASQPNTVATSERTKETAVEPTQISQQSQQPQSHTWLSERFTGEFSRSFSFADRVNQDAVSASLKNGILSIIVPKAAKPENRKITVA